MQYSSILKILARHFFDVPNYSPPERYTDPMRPKFITKSRNKNIIIRSHSKEITSIALFYNFRNQFQFLQSWSIDTDFSHPGSFRLFTKKGIQRLYRDPGGINHGGRSRRQAGDINLKNGITSVRSAGLIGASLYHSAAVIDLQKAARWHTRVRGTTEDARDRWRINLIKCCPHGGAWPCH